MMKRFYYIVSLIVVTGWLLVAQSASAQQLFRLTQYFQNPIVINPATTGIEGFMDVKIGYRQQWSGLDGAPETYYISAHAPLRTNSSSTGLRHNALRISDPSLYDQFDGNTRYGASNVKHGLGGYITSDNQGIFAQTSGFMSYASHLPLGNQLRLAIGVSAGVTNQQIDISRVTVIEPNDPTYLAYRNQQGQSTNFDLNAGMFLYSDRFYVGYSAARIFQNNLYNDSEIAAQQQLTHFGMLGLRLNLSTALMLYPGVYIGYDGANPVTYDVGARVKLKDIVWAGLSYRNTSTIAGMAGIQINNTFNVSYSYDYGFSGINNLQSGIHEITLGLVLFNSRQVAPYLW
ncbi:PorP/SprF family type IX secretion system membrane protein [Tunicatimonas pelagia]|uniref:PorP/SprF family type IX secretion system membrane protein n=1 Tax=Tunicatimonas pelagia TaxID=931531 RepID=UPI002666A274|nr:type IX secretion system membrane protein PorP/SprF [Tunicatimonas pelagia]WKN43605.1 type IX secretion system membrane protein PorP/SprF [Tunicatimonas pelagia]